MSSEFPAKSTLYDVESRRMLGEGEVQPDQDLESNITMKLGKT